MAMDILLPIFVAVPLAASAIAVLLPWRLIRDILHIIVPFAGIFAGIWLLRTPLNTARLLTTWAFMSVAWQSPLLPIRSAPSC